jgi:hypothetical protein
VSEIETKAMERKRRMKQMAKVAVLGAVLALLCRALPVEYQGPCEIVIKICTGSL